MICWAILVESLFVKTRLKFEGERLEGLDGAVLEQEFVERHVRFGMLLFHAMGTHLSRSGVDGQKLPILLLEDHLTDVPGLRRLQFVNAIQILHLYESVGRI